MKRQPNKWEKISSSPRQDKELIYNICKELIQLNSKNHCTLVRIATIKKKSVSEDVEKKESLCIVGENINSCNRGSSKN